MSFFTFNSRSFFTIFLLSALSPFIFFLVGTEYILRIHVKPKDLFFKHKYLFTTSQSEYAAFGDSHVAMGLTALPHFINLAFPGENYETVYEKVLLYSKQIALKKVILAADPNMFSHNRLSQDVGRTMLDYKETLPLLSLYYKHQPFILEYWSTFLKKGTFDETNRVFQSDGSQLAFASVQEKYVDTNKWELFQNETKNRVSGQVPIPDFENSKGYASLVKTIKLLRSQHAEVCLVTFPATPLYRSYTLSFQEFNRALSQYKALSAEYQIQYVNGWNFSDDLKDFTNMDHLSAAGAKKFSRFVGEHCFNLQ